MSEQQLLLGVVAVVIGIAASALLLIPFVFVSYRRHGSLSPWRLALWVCALIYAWGVWTYTLMPLPDPNDLVCSGTNWQLFAFIDDLRRVAAQSDSLTGLVLSRTAMQLTLNVLLFIPLGFLVRVLAGRGILVATMLGLLGSALIETTQITGVWGLYPCAYRVFDVDDLLMNTSGAVIGSLLALFVPRRHWGHKPDAPADAPRPVTKGRKLLAMLCDWLALVLLSNAAATASQAYLLLVAERPDIALETETSGVVGGLVGLAVLTIVTLGTGSTPGDMAVRLHYTSSRLPTGAARLLRFIGGIGGYALLGAIPGVPGIVTGLFAVISLTVVAFSRNPAGIPGWVSGQRLVDTRE